MSSNFVPTITTHYHEGPSLPRPQPMSLAGVGLVIVATLAVMAAGFLLFMWHLLSTMQSNF
jgi:hypothetical protein